MVSRNASSSVRVYGNDLYILGRIVSSNSQQTIRVVFSARPRSTLFRCCHTQSDLHFTLDRGRSWTWKLENCSSSNVPSVKKHRPKVSTVRNYCYEPFVVLTVCCTILPLAVRPVIKAEQRYGSRFSNRNAVPVRSGPFTPLVYRQLVAAAA